MISSEPQWKKVLNESEKNKKEKEFWEGTAIPIESQGVVVKTIPHKYALRPEGWEAGDK